MSLTKEEREELVDALHENAGFAGQLSYEEMIRRFYDSTWSALCHTTGRCGRGFLPEDQTPEARIYRLMLKAFSG
jgi:hypothetical protein